MIKPTLAAAMMTGMVAFGTAAADESTTIGGKAFIDLTYLDQKSDDVKTPSSGTGVDVKRFYLMVDHKFDDVWSANITTDFTYVSNTTGTPTQVFIKKAYLQAKLSDALFARVGSADLPWVPFVEGLYSYRYVENVLIDRLKFGTSADWGVHAGGKVADGLVSYAVSAVNGAGYKNPTRSKSMDVEGRLAYNPLSALTVAAAFYSGKLGKDVQGATTFHRANRFDALVTYVNTDFRLGGEYFSANDWNQITSATSDKSDGFSFWGSYNLRPDLSVFARGDSVKPRKDINSGLKDRYYNVGIAFRPRKNVDLALAYKYEKVENGPISTLSGLVSTSNGSIGGKRDGKYSEIGFWGQVTF